MARFELYTTVHAGLRAALFDAAGAAARTDPGDPAAVAGLAAQVRRLVGFLDEHAAHEDAILMPEILRLAPGVHAALQAEHEEADGLQREAARLAGALELAEGAARGPACRALQDLLVRLTAVHLLHMQREEREAQAALWAGHDDAALAALHRTILAAIPPARMAAWQEIILPALAPAERAALERAAAAARA